MKIGFIVLGNVGAKLAESLLRNKFDIIIKDLDSKLEKKFYNQGAQIAKNQKNLAEKVDVIITCLPSPEICSTVMEADDGVIKGLTKNKIWLEMSTTDSVEVKRIGALVKKAGAMPLDCPVSGGCHRAATGNISILVGGDKNTFNKVLPVLSIMGRKILHTGELGSASILKIVTNYLASVNLVSVGEALTVAKKSGMDLKTTYEAIKISSGNSFVHETESQVILNGSYNINFTMDLVLKDMGLFNDLSIKNNIPLEISPLVLSIFKDGQKKYGPKAWSSMIVKRLEDACNINLRALGFPAELKDSEPEKKGHQI